MKLCTTIILALFTLTINAALTPAHTATRQVILRNFDHLTSSTNQMLGTRVTTMMAHPEISTQKLVLPKRIFKSLPNVDPALSIQRILTINKMLGNTLKFKTSFTPMPLIHSVLTLHEQEDLTKAICDSILDINLMQFENIDTQEMPKNTTLDIGLFTKWEICKEIFCHPLFEIYSNNAPSQATENNYTGC